MEGSSTLWICDRGCGAKVLSSEELAEKLQQLLDSGISNLHVAIGGPDGFSEETLRTLKPNLRWSFGSMTLPHELAAVVASEQLYRAWTILKKHPYHLGH